jgi:hypothetical protein
MRITRRLFEAHVKCTMKCWLRSIDEPKCSDPSSQYAEWIGNKIETYRRGSVERLMRETPQEKYVVAVGFDNIRAAQWQLAFDVEVHTVFLKFGLMPWSGYLQVADKPTSFFPFDFRSPTN